MPRNSTKTAGHDAYGDAGAHFPAPYACFPAKSRGRLHKEEESPNRSAYQRDRDRIIHSTAFRRLEYKTQVFVNHEGDHYRTRLTHSLEVAQLTRSAARELGLDEDLAEALALSHDLGHPPFGHAGEDALKEVMKEYGGFDHNAQSLRILTSLERIYAEFDGLNLTWETLEGVAKHNGPLVNKKGGRPKARALHKYNAKHDLELHTYPGLEAQISAICDDIAYNNHDIEDGLRAGLFVTDDLLKVPLLGDILKEVQDKYPDLEEPRLIHETKRRLINIMSGDLVAQTRKTLLKNNIKTADEIRNMGEPGAGFSAEMKKNNAAIKAFLMERMYRHYKVNRMTTKAKRLVKELFIYFMEEPESLPTQWQKRIEKPGSKQAAEVVADFIAGMTDRFAFEEYKRVFDMSYKLIGG